MAEEMNTPSRGCNNDVIKGDFATILVGVGTILDNAFMPLSKMVSQALDSLTIVAKQILDGVSSTLGEKK